MREFSEITSKDNSLIKFIPLLQTSKKAREENGLFVLEGLRICCDLYDNTDKFDKLIVSKTAYEKYYEKIEKLSIKADKCYLLPDGLFKKISDTSSPQGIIAVSKIPEKGQKIDKFGRYIALENISDPSNLGAVSRTAEALGVSGIILSSGGCDPYSPKVLRASMGTLLRMPVYITESITEFVNSNGLRSFACVVDETADKITEIDFKDGDVIIIGNEANGILDETQKNAFKRVTIPMSGKAESLNASVAAAIASWEMMKR